MSSPLKGLGSSVAILCLCVSCAQMMRGAPTEKNTVSPAEYSYRSTSNAPSNHITIAVVGPQFFDDTSEVLQKYNYSLVYDADETARSLTRALRSSFGELLTTKGFEVLGPFASLDEMTYSEKMSSDIVVRPTLDLEFIIEEAPRASQALGNAKKCSGKLLVSGAVNLAAFEALTNISLWIKRVPVSIVLVTNLDAYDCKPETLNEEFDEAWVGAHETIFATVMAALDQQVSAEEFKVLSAQAA